MMNQGLTQCGPVTKHTAIKTSKYGDTRPKTAQSARPKTAQSTRPKTALSVSRNKYAAKLKAIKAATEEAVRVKSEVSLSKVVCKYCKETGHVVGHFDKSLGHFVTTCSAAIATNERKAASKARRDGFTRTNAKRWQNQMSSAANTDTGTTGWNTNGSKWSAKTAEPKPRVSFASVNRFDMGEEDDIGPVKDDVERWYEQQTDTFVPAGVWGDDKSCASHIVEAEETRWEPVTAMIDEATSNITKEMESKTDTVLTTDTCVKCGEWGCACDTV